MGSSFLDSNHCLLLYSESCPLFSVELREHLAAAFSVSQARDCRLRIGCLLNVLAGTDAMWKIAGRMRKAPLGRSPGSCPADSGG